MTQVEAELGPRQESWNADLLISNDGIPRTMLQAPIWQEFGEGDSTYSVLLSNPDIDSIRVVAKIFDEVGDQTAVVTADEMQFFDGEGRIEASGQVIVVTSTDRVLRTERLLWWEEEAKIVAPGYVSLTAPRETIQGYNLDSDEKLENYTLGRVTGQILVDE